MNDRQMNNSHYPYVRPPTPIPIDVSKGEYSLPVLSFLYSNQVDKSELSPPSLSPHLDDNDYQNVDILTPNNDLLQKNLASYLNAENPILNDKSSMGMDNCSKPSICYPYTDAENLISSDECSMGVDNCPMHSAVAKSTLCSSSAMLIQPINQPRHSVCYSYPVIDDEEKMDWNSIPDSQEKEYPHFSDISNPYSNISDADDSIVTNAVIKSPLLNIFPSDIRRHNESIMIDMTKCTICKKNEALKDISFSTNNSIKHIVLYIKSILTEIYGSYLGEQIKSIEYEFQDKYRFLELFSNLDNNEDVLKNDVVHKKICSVPSIYTIRPFENKGVGIILKRVDKETLQNDEATKLFPKHAKNKAVLKNEVIHKKICPVPSTYTIRPFENEGTGIILRRVVREETLQYDEATKALNKKQISYFFPKLMTKIAKCSKSDRAVQKTLKSKKSLFILSCKARLAWKFSNIDASALFKLSAIEIERGNLNKAFTYYRRAGISLLNMIFRDKIFSFFGKTELTSIKELPHSDATYFLYRQVNIALMNDDSIFSFTFDETDCIKLNETELDGAKAIKSIGYFSMEDLKNVAARFN